LRMNTNINGHSKRNADLVSTYTVKYPG